MNCKILILIVIAAVVFGFVHPGKIYAQVNDTISANGSSSGSQILTTQNQTNGSGQTNNGTVSNSTSTNSNTGSNSTSGESASTSFTTGSISASTSVQNSGNTNTSASSACSACGNQTSASINGNGSSSSNQVQVQNLKDTSLISTQNASVFNNQKLNLNTGGNQISGSPDASQIQTGSINISNTVVNSGINSSTQIQSSQPDSNNSLEIWGNGANTQNLVNIQNSTTFVQKSFNNASITSNFNSNLNTGGNTLLGNQGPVLISTGSVYLSQSLLNEAVNTSEAAGSSNCSCQNGNGTSTPPSGTPSNSGGTRSSPTPSNTTAASVPSASTVLGLAQGSPPTSPVSEILGAFAQMPATGANQIFYLTFIAALFFVLGLYLRFHPGQDPGFMVTYG